MDGRAILQWDVFASNGIIHVISRPLKAPPTPLVSIQGFWWGGVMSSPKQQAIARSPLLSSGPWGGGVSMYPPKEQAITKSPLLSSGHWGASHTCSRAAGLSC